MRLRPGMFVQVSLEVPLGTDVIAVPRSAVLDTGKEKVVYVAKEDGVFEKRPIETFGNRGRVLRGHQRESSPVNASSPMATF